MDHSQRMNGKLFWRIVCIRVQILVELTDIQIIKVIYFNLTTSPTFDSNKVSFKAWILLDAMNTVQTFGNYFATSKLRSLNSQKAFSKSSLTKRIITESSKLVKIFQEPYLVTKSSWNHQVLVRIDYSMYSKHTQPTIHLLVTVKGWISLRQCYCASCQIKKTHFGLSCTSCLKKTGGQFSQMKRRKWVTCYQTWRII